jgi:pimeloyl-ACP methyl ester carboxylesterase
VDGEQREKSSYVALFLQEGKAEHVLAGEDYRRLRAMFSFGPNPDAVPRGVIEHFTKSLSRPGRLTAALNYYRANLGAGGGAWAALTQELKITSPTTLLWGDLDPALGRRAVEATAGHVEGPYDLVVLEGAGHWLQFERPDEVRSALTRAAQPD